jgi:AcrR family transcriptional regulator
MKKQRSDSRETRRRLLAAASEVFAEKGFWEATNADICEKAKVNTAAVNYHFISKENLYVETWKYSFERSIRAHPVDGGVSPDSTAQERLHGRIKSFIQRITDPETHDLEIMHKEVVNPTGLLAETITKAIEPIDQGLKLVIQELLGSSASEQQVLFCFISIMSQCLGFVMHLRASKNAPGFQPTSLPQLGINVEEVADHITQFSLAGINRLCEQALRKRESSKRDESRGNTGPGEVN